MAKQKDPIENPKDKNMLIGIVWNCGPELKLVLSGLLFMCSIITLFQFFPAHLSFSVQDLRHCAVIQPPPPPPPSSPNHHLTSTVTSHDDNVEDAGLIKRRFRTYGSAAYNFILMSAYRGGGDTFAVIGLSSKPLHVFGKPNYVCQWLPHNYTAENPNITVSGTKILPDWGYGRVYTVVVVNCTFPAPVGGGGKLILHASTSGGGDSNYNLTDSIEALIETETENENGNSIQFTNPSPKYDYLYCGSPLYGNLSPQRIREWMAYHARLFGDKSHFVIHDAGGVHPQVMDVFRPWVEKGYVTIHDIRDEERFDGYYHNQFLVVNDCLHRYRLMAKWIFFFDVDEFVFVPKKSTIKSVMDSLSGYTQFTIEQRTMANNICYVDDHPAKIYSKWGMEKLVYQDMVRGIRRDRKYAVQPRNVFATGVHMSENTIGKTTHNTEGKIMYYHYHGTISERREPCRRLVNVTELKVGKTPYKVDKTMREVAGAVKRFEMRMIGSVLAKTRQ